MRIYNSLSRKKEDFVPLDGNNVKMYACGITVSGEAHVGHAYQALIYDIMRKYLIKKGYAVTYARNYTDVDDKIIARANELNLPFSQYAEMMIEKIDAEMRALQVDDPDVWIKATETMNGIISFISQLIDKGHAYATQNGDVYFAVNSFNGYGKLSGRNLEDAHEGVRIDNEEDKLSPLDFALWKAAKPGDPFWESPWGKGRPGWHIECSAMNLKAFGEQIDIHGGGRDLVFPHHENEIAQSEALTGKPFAKYWVHNGLIKVNGQKMSKSLGNSLLLADLLSKFSPEVIKFALLQTNYRGDINITDSLFPDVEKHLVSFYTTLAEANKKGVACDGAIPQIDSDFDSAMDDDFNTAKAIANLFALFKKASSALKEEAFDLANNILGQIKKTYSLLGLFRTAPEEFLASVASKKDADIPAEVLALARQRAVAKQEKNWAKADRLRAEITYLGFSIKDSRDGYTLEKLS